MRGRVIRRNSVRGRRRSCDEKSITKARQYMRVNCRLQARERGVTEAGGEREVAQKAERDMSNCRRANNRARLN
jgi:hypothetical protein